MHDDAAETRLATYGTLSPGQSNHHQLDGLVGTWRVGRVRGHRHASGWGASAGYPVFVAAADGPEVTVQLFESADLPKHWPRLDVFEGEGYRRAVIEVQTEHGPVLANIYLAVQAGAD